MQPELKEECSEGSRFEKGFNIIKYMQIWDKVHWHQPCEIPVGECYIISVISHGVFLMINVLKHLERWD